MRLDDQMLFEQLRDGLEKHLRLLPDSMTGWVEELRIEEHQKDIPLELHHAPYFPTRNVPRDDLETHGTMDEGGVPQRLRVGDRAGEPALLVKHLEGGQSLIEVGFELLVVHHASLRRRLSHSRLPQTNFLTGSHCRTHRR
jgi:hypothetical protein